MFGGLGGTRAHRKPRSGGVRPAGVLELVGGVVQGVEDPGTEIPGRIDDGEAAAHPDAEASGGGPPGADVTDEWRGVRSADAIAEGGLEERAEGPESEERVDDVGVGLAGGGGFEVPAMPA